MIIEKVKNLSQQRLCDCPSLTLTSLWLQIATKYCNDYAQELRTSSHCKIRKDEPLQLNL